jgi:capsular exopolysaccharide synthesis family protein
VLGILLGLLATTGAKPMYRASVTFFVTTSGGESGPNAQVNSDEFAQRRVNSYLKLLGTDRLAEMVVAAADVQVTAGQVEGMIGAKGDIDTVLFTATVTSASKELATSVADAVATEFVKLVDEVETTDTNAPAVNLEVVDGPTVRELPSKPMFALAWRAMLGGIIGLGIALLLELRDQTLRSEDDLIAVGATPVLGTIPYDRLVESAPLLVEASRHSNFAEAFRQLRTNLQFVDVEHRVQVLVVTSSVPGEGKSVTCSNLALSLAAAGRQVLLIEADLRLPRISHYFGIDRTVGLTDVLIGRAALDEVVRPIPGTSLTVLPSGHAPPNPSELLGSDAMRSVLAELRTRFDIIVVDTPPLLPVADGAVAAAWADGVVLLVRTAKTPRQQVTLSLRSLSSVGARLVGAVMTMAPQGAGSRYSSYDYRAGDDLPDGRSAVPTLRHRPSIDRPPAGERRAPTPTPAPATRGATAAPAPVPPPPPAVAVDEPTEPGGGFNTHIETLLKSESPEAVRAGLNALKLAKVDDPEPPAPDPPRPSPARRSTRGTPRPQT